MGAATDVVVIAVAVTTAPDCSELASGFTRRAVLGVEAEFKKPQLKVKVSRKVIISK
jgi:hypothetical protein